MKNSKFAIGSKTMIAAAIAAMMSGAAMAATYEKPKEDVKVFTAGTTQEALDKETVSNFWYAPTETGILTFLNGSLSEGKNLWVIASKAGQKLTGLYASGADDIATNDGTIKVQAQGDAKSWQQKGMLAQNGGTAVNNGTIEADKGYGMTVGSGDVGATIINATSGKITVTTEGTAMELGTSKNMTGINRGTITVEKAQTGAFAVGALIKGAQGTFTNEGTIEAGEGAYAISVEGHDGDDNQVDTVANIVLADGSKTIGNVQVKGKNHNTNDVVATFAIAQGAQVQGNFELSTGEIDIDSDNATIHGDINVSGDADLAVEGNLAVQGVEVKGGVFSMDSGTLTFVAPLTRADEETPDITIGNGKFFVAKDAGIVSNWVDFTGGEFNSFGTLDIEKMTVAENKGNTQTVNFKGGKADIANLKVEASGTAPVGIANDADVTIGNVTVTGTSSTAIRIDDGTLTLTGKVVNAKDTHIVNLAGGTVALTDTTDLSGASAGAIYLAGGTLSTDSSLFRNEEGEIVANDIVADNPYDANTSTISFTDDTMSIEDLKSLNTTLAGLGSDFEVLADTITTTDENGAVTTLTEMKIADWAGINGTTLASVSAVSDSLKINQKFGAKNVILTGEDTGSDDLTFTGSEFTFVGGAQGTELIVSRNETDPIELENIFVTSNATLNLGSDNATSYTYGVLSGARLSVGTNSVINVRNGDFTLAKGLSVNADGEVNVADGAILRTADTISEAGNITADSVVNNGKMLVDGTLYAETIAQNQTLKVEGALYATTITAGQSAATSNTGLVVLSGVKQTAEGATGWDVGTGNMTIGPKTIAEAEGEQGIEQEGGVLVVGNGSQAAAAYHAENHLDNLVWVGQETKFADSVTFGTKASGTMGGKYTTGSNVVAIDVNGLASSGYAAGADLDKTAKVITSKTAIAADKLVIANLQSINKGMLVFNEATENFELKVGDVTAGQVDLGTSFYHDGKVTEGTVAFDANEDRVDDLLGGLAVEGEVLDSLNNFNFGRNELVDAVVFGTDAYEESLKASFKKIAEANGWEVGSEEYNQQRNEFMKAGWDRYEEGIDSVSYMAVLGGAFSTAVDINNEVWKSLDRRMSAANLNAPRNAYGVTPWVDVIGTTNEAKDLFGGAGYEADIYGAVLGADWTAPCGAILGLAFSVGQADANSADWGNKVENDVDFWGVSLYGSHRIGNFNGKVDFGYISTSNDLSTHTVLGKFDESLDADIYTFGLGAEYIVEAGAFNVVPHAGIRWSRIDMDDSKFGADYDAMNLFQMPLGVTFSGTIDMTGWKVAPMVDLSVVPAFGDKDAVASYMGGYTDSTRVVDTNPIQMTLGVNAQVDAWTFGVNYGLTAGGDERLNNSFNLNARYTF